MKTKTKKRAPSSKTQRRTTLVAFLLDRTGSMAACRAETISGFNAYVEQLKENLKTYDVRFTLTQFDTMSIDTVVENVPLHRVPKLTTATFQPRANTPLYDAIGKTVAEVEQKAKKDYNIIFVTLTDGEDNASSEFTCPRIQELIKCKEAEGWTFAHIGTGVNGWTAAQAYSYGTQSSTNVLRTSHKNTVKAYAAMARSVGHTVSLKSLDPKAHVMGMFGQTDLSEDED